jgi:hypothetical protein
MLYAIRRGRDTVTSRAPPAPTRTDGASRCRAGTQQGIEREIGRSLVDVYEARFGAMEEEIRAAIEDTHDETILRGWLKLAGTRGADEVAAAIRAFHPN